MTTGATAQLGLALPVQGELSGTWGDTVNNGITQYTNIAIAGTLTLTGDGAVTLANTTGDASASNITSTLAGAGTVTAQFAAVRVSGTTTTKVVTGPSYSKTYLVDNASSFAVTFKASGQTGVSVAAAEKVSVYFNGTDYVKIAGTIANAAGSNTQIQFNNGGLFGASANLTWDGTTLSSTQVNITGQGTLRLQDTTGGEYVGLRSPGTLGASYTLTFPADDGTSGQALITDGSGVLSWSTAASGDVYGPGSSTDNAVARFDETTGKLLQNSVVLIGDTGAVTGVTDLSASGAVTLSGGTANGVAYLNGSKVVTSGSALTFDGTNFAVGTSNFDMYDTNAGSNVSTYYRLKYTGGNGSTNVGTVFSNDSSGSALGFWRNNSSSKPVRGVAISADWSSITAGSEAASLIFSTQTGGASVSEQMRLTSTGLGIGTSSPANKLHVVYGGSAVGAQFTASAGYAQMQLTAAGANQNAYYTFNVNGSGKGIIQINATDVLTLDSSGNLGLGVTPTAQSNYAVFDLKGRESAQAAIISFFTSDGTKTGAIQSDTTYGALLAAGGARPIAFFTNSSERARIDSSGNFGIGTSSPAYKLDVAGTINSSASTATGFNMTFRTTGITTGRAQTYLNNTSGDFLTGIEGSTAGQTISGSAAYSAYAGTFTANPLYLVTNATIKATLDSAGNLGLGVTPSAWNSDYKVLNYGSAGLLYGRVGSQEVAFGTNWYRDSAASFLYSTTGYASYYAQVSGAHSWYTAASGTAGNAITFTQAMTLEAAGTLLVGMTTDTGIGVALFPSGITRKNTNGTVFDQYRYAGASVGTTTTDGVNIQYNAASSLVFGTNGSTERARIDSSGNFMVGATSAAGKFTVVGGTTSLSLSAAGTQTVLKLNNDDTTVGTNAVKLGFTSSNVVKSSINVAVYNNDYMTFNVGSDTERMRIDASGNLLVGTTTTNRGSSGFHVATNGQFFSSTDSATNVNLRRLVSNGDVATFTATSGSIVGAITIDATTTTYNTSSDYRLKNTIAPMTGALAKVALLKPCTYKWNADGSDGEGFIAHELAEVVPQCVTGEKDAVDEDGNPKYQGIDTSFLVATLTAALQEQQAIIESLKARLDAANL
jgi:hypothetical protein